MRRWHLAILAVLSLLALACEGSDGAGGPAPDPTTTKPASRWPATTVALGDSITAGYGSCGVYVACSRNSWSAGGSDDVDSHYRRIRARFSKAKARNLAVPGAEAADLRAQAANAVDARADYVTILIGANDACAPGTGTMTPVKTFRTRVDAALDRLKDGLPRARVLVVSIPDLYRLWELGHSSPAAVAAWDRGICPSMLARPTSTAAADERRRDAVRERIEDYNTQLSRACDAYGNRCRTDGGAAHRVRFSLDLVNKVDYFHPNLAGQNKLADVTWPGRITW
ncbi:SGNH/GDSL hydrolase family protein [Symbioplanes lichenis]|uniref:SGNH/GDSL hydrolase family protein n=1 Tax=Symbioplanes lichenis TaxID=1629072 RepID=UPI002738C7D0|nr:GDSL-type esterase/lipase family protein [Actinoplanes lichenis]